MAAWIAAGVLGALGLALLTSGLGSTRRRPVTGGAGALAGLALLIAAAIVVLAGVNMHTYSRLTTEQYLAQIELSRTGPQAFSATLCTPDGEERTFQLEGDEWRLDARVIKLPRWAGGGAVYRLDSLGGGYADAQKEADARPIAHPLSDNPGLDVWRLARDHGRALKVDTSFSSPVSHPLADGAVYEVDTTLEALVSRPMNQAAVAATGRQEGRKPGASAHE